MTKKNKSKSKKKNINANICNSNLTFEECELTILRMQIDKSQSRIAREKINNPEIKKIFKIVENFIKQKELICYGGISINALLPPENKIYDPSVDLPDYDMFSYNALDDAKELADIFYLEGYKEVEAKPGVHHNTYKVFVNYIGVADITYINKSLFKSIKREAVNVDGILYTDPNYLKMAMYLELSRPAGDTSRWEKILKRLTLINKYYPLPDNKCEIMNFQREISDENKENTTLIFNIVRNGLVKQGVVFFGYYAIQQIYA